MYKGFQLWYDSHPETDVMSKDGTKVVTKAHPTEMYTAGGLRYLCCMSCHVSQTVDEVDALMRHVEPSNEQTRLFVAPSDGHVHAPPAVEKISGSGVISG